MTTATANASFIPEWCFGLSHPAIRIIKLNLNAGSEA
jgi:hypothetical protein